MEIRFVKAGPLNVYFEWDAVPGAVGYLFFVDGVLVSRSNDGSQTTTRFRKSSTPRSYKVQAIMPGESGAIMYPAAPVPTPTPTPTRKSDPLMPLKGY